ncbi:hypothetical protein CC79DRAFT_1372774 [Sarocladium strictum]
MPSSNHPIFIVMVFLGMAQGAPTGSPVPSEQQLRERANTDDSLGYYVTVSEKRANTDESLGYYVTEVE